jgi:hypothetical protein
MWLSGISGYTRAGLNPLSIFLVFSEAWITPRFAVLPVPFGPLLVANHPSTVDAPLAIAREDALGAKLSQ